MSKRVLFIASFVALFTFGPMLVAAEDLPDPLAAGWIGETTSVYLIVESF